MADNTNDLAKSMTKQYCHAIGANVKKLLDQRGWSQAQLIRELKERGLEVNPGNMSSYLKPEKSIPLSIIVQFCEIFDVSLSDLVNPNFDYSTRNIIGSGSSTLRVYSTDLPLQLPNLGPSFVTDPNKPEFHGYLQTYYTYFLPTLPGEQKLLTGTLTLEANEAVCEATLKLNINKVKNGQPIYKIYRGRAIISTSVRAVYILLTNDTIGELTVLNFRYFKLHSQPLDCRMVEVLTNAAGEDHPPTVHRMFMSRDEIRPEHLPLLIPHLYLNSSELYITEDNLELLRSESADYIPLVDALAAPQPPVRVYRWNEKYIHGLVEPLLDQNQLHVFISRIRDLSVHKHLNKASRQADTLTHNLLLSLDYFKDLYTKD